MKPSDKYEETLDKALYAVTMATHHQIWQDVDTRPTNEVAYMLKAIIDTLRAAADDYTENDFHHDASTMHAAAEIVVTLYCRSVRSYSDARDYAQAAYALGPLGERGFANR